jgi:hypothetical protein
MAEVLAKTAENSLKQLAPNFCFLFFTITSKSVTVTSLLLVVSPQTKCNSYIVTVSNGLSQFVMSYFYIKFTKPHYIVTCTFQNMIITY